MVVQGVIHPTIKIMGFLTDAIYKRQPLTYSHVNKSEAFCCFFCVLYPSYASYASNFSYVQTIKNAPKGAVTKIPTTEIDQANGPTDRPAAKGTPPIVACTVAFGKQEKAFSITPLTA